MTITQFRTVLFDPSLNVPGIRRCKACGRFAPIATRIDTETDDGLIESYCQACYPVLTRSAPSKPKRQTTIVKPEDLPSAVTFSRINAGGQDSDDLFEDGDMAVAHEDPGILNAATEESFLFVLRALPKDRHRVIALLLFLNQLGYGFRYEDIGSLWGITKEATFGHIDRMKKQLKRAGVGTEGRQR